MAPVGVVAQAAPAATAAAPGFRLTDLRVEQAVRPLAVASVEPRFSWITESDRPSLEPTHHRVVVATTAKRAGAGNGNVWDSGLLPTADAVDVAYDGPALNPETRYHWAVEVVSESGEKVRSEATWFETGLAESGWDGSEWISVPTEADNEPLTLAGASWMWHPEGQIPTAPAGLRHFRTVLEPAAGKTAVSAEVLITADDGYRLFLNGGPVGQSANAANTWMTAQRFTLDLTGSGDVLAVEGRNSWDPNGVQQPSPAGVLAKIRITHSDGTTVTRSTGPDAGWRSSVSAAAGWNDKGFNDSGWSAVTRQAVYGSGPWAGNVTVPAASGLSESLTKASWIWHADGTPPRAPQGTRYFRRSVTVDPAKELTGAELVMTADDRFTAHLNGQLVGRSSSAAEAWRDAQVFELKDLEPGANVIAVEAYNSDFAAGGASPAGLLGFVRLSYSDGEVVVVPTDASWRTTKVETAGWRERGHDDSAWTAAVVHAAYGSGDWGSNVVITERTAAPVLRSEFTLPRDVLSARLHVAAGGFVDTRLNGAAVSDEVLSVSHTDYDKRVHYATHDVSSQLRRGANALLFELGRGFYSLPTSNSWGWEKAPWFQPHPTVRAVLRVTFTDGTTQTIGTDDQAWRQTDGPRTFDSLYEGDFYDARAELTGADQPGFDTAGWTRVAAVEGPKGALTARVQPPIRVQETLRPTAITEPSPGVFVAAFPRQVAGWARIRVTGPTGAEVQLRYGERLLGNGNVNSSTGFTGGAFQTDKYLLAGRPGGETWEPRFSYKGFRYVEITGWPGAAPTVDDIDARLVHNDVARTSTFSTSEPLFEQIHTGVVDTVLNNFHHIPTDTPTYEKNGWTGDAQLGAEMFLRNLDSHSFLAKWLDDVEDSRHDDGRPALIAPDPNWDWGVNMQSPTWHAAYVLIPWWLYEHTGDRRVVEKHYDGIVKYLRLEHSRANGHLSTTGLGDYMSPDQVGNPPEDMSVSSTAYVHEMTTVAAEMADLVGRPQDATEMRTEAAAIRTAFNAAYYDAEAKVYRDATAGYRQTHNVLALEFGLVPDGDEQAVADGIARDITENRDGHLWTGVLGTKYLLPLLTEYGHGDLAHRVATQTTYPSWGRWFSSAEGSTSMWEAWDDYRSRNHYFLGTIDDWFYEDLVGITPASPGYRTISIAPQVVGDLTRAAGSTRTPLGEVSSSWRLADGAFELDVTVPVGATAVVSVPVGDGQVATGPAAAVELGTADGRTEFRVSSGDWTFRAAVPVVDPPVEEVDSTTTVVAPSEVRKGKSVRVAVRVAAAGDTPTGAVTVWSGNTRLAAGSLAAGRATFVVPTTSVPVGRLPLRAVYAGSDRVAGSEARTAVRVRKAVARVSATPSRPTVRRGGALHSRVVVRAEGLVPQGRVVLWAKGRRVGSGTLSNGVVRVKVRTAALRPGRTVVRVAYAGSTSVLPGVTRFAVRVRR